MGPRAALGVILLGGMLVMALLQPVTFIRLDTGDGTLLACARVTAGTPFTLTFTHSMYGGFVRETYVVNDAGTLERQQIVTENAAAAEYYATDGRVRPVPDGYEVLAGPFVTDELVIRPGGIGDHRLEIGDRAWQLSGIFREPVQVRISGDRAPRTRVPDACERSGANLATKGLIA